MLKSEGIVHLTAVGVQYTMSHRAVTEGLDLLSRKGNKKLLKKHGVIVEGNTEGKKQPLEMNQMCMVTTVFASCNPGFSVLAFEKELQRLCNKNAQDGALWGCCLMFGTKYKPGGALKNAYTNGIIGQATFSLWVPEQYGERVYMSCNELAFGMENHDSFPDVLKGQFKEASDDPLGLELPMKLFNEMLRDEPDDELVWIIGHLKEHTDSVLRIGACVTEQNRRALEL